MAKDLHDDNLERFFKRQFDKQASEPAEAWDTPSSEVWLGVKASLPNPPKPFYKSPWFILSAGIIIGALTVFLYFGLTSQEEIIPSNKENVLSLPQANTNESSKSEGHLSETSNKASNTATKTGNVEDITENQSIAETNTNKTTPAEKAGIPNPEKPAFNKDEEIVNETDFSNQPNSIQFFNESASSPEISESNKAMDLRVDQILSEETKQRTDIGSTNIEDQIPSKQKNQKQQLSNLDILTQKKMFLTNEDEVTDLKVMTLLPPESIISNKISPWSLALNASPSYSFRQLRKAPPNLPQPPPGFLEEEKPNIGLSATINVGYNLSKHWSLVSGLNYLQHRQKSKKLGFLRYSNQGGQMNGSEYTNDYSVNVNTSFGDGELEIRVSDERTGDQMDLKNGDKIRYEIDHNILVQQVGIPLLGQYTRQFGKFSIGLYAGLVGSKIVDRQVDASIRILGPHPRLRQTKLKVRKSFDNLKNYHVDWQVGSVLTYHINPTIGLQLKPNYRQSFTDVFDKNGIKTYPYALALDAGIIFNL